MPILAPTLAALWLLTVPPPGPARLAAFDPSQLPATTGRVAQYSLTPRGDVDGVFLEDGTEVYLPPRLGRRLAQIVRPGDPVIVHGLHARAIPVIQALSITNPASGQSVADSADPGPAPRPASPDRPDTPARNLLVTGTVKAPLHGPRGDLNGALLSDGTILRLPPAEASRAADRLRPGMRIAADGPGLSGPSGRVLAPTRIGPDPEHLQPVDGGRPRGPPPPLPAEP